MSSGECHAGHLLERSARGAGLYRGYEAETEMVIIRKGEKIAALMVDEFIGQQEIVLKSLGSYLINQFAISGATILGDGQVALIIDTNALMKWKLLS